VRDAAGGGALPRGFVCLLALSFSEIHWWESLRNLKLVPNIFQSLISSQNNIFHKSSLLLPSSFFLWKRLYITYKLLMDMPINKSMKCKRFYLIKCFLCFWIKLKIKQCIWTDLKFSIIFRGGSDGVA
jgi:hypothetical protein